MVVIAYKSVIPVVPAIIVFALVIGQEETDRTTQSKSVEELVACIVLQFNKVHPLSWLAAAGLQTSPSATETRRSLNNA